MLSVWLEILNLQPSCTKFSSLTTTSLPLWRMRSQQEWCYVYHTDSDLFCVWYHVAPCHWLMLPAPPLWWLDPWLRLQLPCKNQFLSFNPQDAKSSVGEKKWMSEGEIIGEVILKDDIASLCAVIPSLTNAPHPSWWHAPLYKWVMSKTISYVSHNALRHLLSTFTCNET